MGLDMKDLANRVHLMAGEVRDRMPVTLEGFATYSRGYASRASGAGGSGGHPGRGSASPTENLALAPMDEIDRDAQELEDKLRRAYTALDEAIAIMFGYVPNAFPRPGVPCLSCFRDRDYFVSSDKRYWQMRLCAWCGHFHDIYGRIPPMAIIRMRHDGHRITRRIIMLAFRREDDETEALKGEDGGNA